MIKKQSSRRETPSKARSLENALKSKRPKQDASRLVSVHISAEEVIGFNSLQATEENPTGQYVDEKTGLREYSRLSRVFRVPKIRDLFLQTSELMFSGKPIPKEIEEIQKQPMPGEENGLIPIPSDSEPSTQEVADAGTGRDKILVMMPEDVVHFLDILQGGKNEDPEYGLQQFGFFDDPFGSIGNGFKSVVRVAATVVGGVGGFAIGGPAGAAAGAYAGNTLGRMSTGQKFGGSNPAWRAAIPNAAYGYGAGSGLSAMGYGAPAAAATAAPIVNGAASTAPGVTAASTPYVAGTASQLAPAVAPAVASTGSLLGSMQPYLLPGALLAGSYMMTQKGNKQKENEWKEEKAEHDAKLKGINDYANQGLEGDIRQQPEIDERTKHGYHLGKYRKERQRKADRYLKTGGSVKVLSTKGNPLKGPGKGQDDLIHKSIPEYTWIHDAHTVSALGDGTTDAGHKELHAFEKKIKKEMLPLYKDQLMEQIKHKKPRQVPCAVANGERETPLLLVGALGEGSFEKGAKVLRKMTRAIRKHKTSKKHGLPSAAHELSVYYKKALRGE